MSTQTLSRWSKILLLSGIALFFTLVVFGNVTDFNSNYQFVHHTLLMDTTFQSTHAMWRAVHSPLVETAFYIGIIAWETLCAVLTWQAALALWRARHESSEAFHHAKRFGIAALTAGMMLWLVSFLCVGGEWFLMWQSRDWNGQQEAFRMFMVEAVVLVLLQMHDASHVPLDQ